MLCLRAEMPLSPGFRFSTVRLLWLLFSLRHFVTSSLSSVEPRLWLVMAYYGFRVFRDGFHARLSPPQLRPSSRGTVPRIPGYDLRSFSAKADFDFYPGIDRKKKSQAHAGTPFRLIFAPRSFSTPHAGTSARKIRCRPASSIRAGAS